MINSRVSLAGLGDLDESLSERALPDLPYWGLDLGPLPGARYLQNNVAINTLTMPIYTSSDTHTIALADIK